MADPSNLCLDLSLSSDPVVPRQGNVWRPSFLSSNGPLTGEDSMMKDAQTATIVARNLLTPEDSRMLSRRSDELAVQESLALSVQCAGSVSNMGQRLLACSRQVESLMAEVENLKQEIKQLKYENRSLYVLANNYSTGMKRKLDELQESNGRMQSDRQRLATFFQRRIFPGSSSVPPSTDASSLMPPASVVFPSSEASSKRPL